MAAPGKVNGTFYVLAGPGETRVNSAADGGFAVMRQAWTV